MDSTSIRRSCMTFTNTASRIEGEDIVSLNNVIEVLRRSNIQGPIPLQACHKGAVSLGAGAQFDVYGRRMQVSSGIPRFDVPYLVGPEWHTKNDTPESFRYTPRYVAIKRAYVSGHRTPASGIALHVEPKRGVERSQLRNVVHEISALVHPLLREHPNIITLLGWGYDQHENDAALFSPILVVEYARASAETLSLQITLPLAVKKHICHGLLSGIKALHECGIVHSDIKPGNILIFARDDSPFFCIAKVSDFGFAEEEIRDRSIKVSELPRGTNGWAAPEQERGDIVSIDLIHRRDIWGCGMTVWSIMALRGQLPSNPSKTSALEADMRSLFTPENPSTDLMSSLAASLCTPVAQRADSVEDIRTSLEQSVWTDSLEIKESFQAHFVDAVDWSKLTEDSLTVDSALFTDALTPQNKRRRDREARMSWSHSLDIATSYNARDYRLLTHLVAEGCSITERFNISLAHAQDNRYSEELDALHQTAQEGFLPAQALYPSLADTLPRLKNSHSALSRDEWKDWLGHAVSSGFLYSDTAILEHADRLRARRAFKEQGGYNTHYCGSKSGKVAVNGLLGKLEEDLLDAPLHLAAACDDLVTPYGISSLLDSTIDINSRDHWEDTALMKCCMAGHLASLRVLINHGADASITNPTNGLSPLHWLFMFNEEDIEEAISLMIKCGADPKRSSKALAVKAFHFPFGWPSGGPLHWAVFAQSNSAVQALLDNGADLSETDAAGQDSLMIAMKIMNVSLTELLLSHCDKAPHQDPLRHFSIAHKERYHLPADLTADHASDEERTPAHVFMWEPLSVGTDPEFEDWVSEEVSLTLDHYTAVFSGRHRAEHCIEILKMLQKQYSSILSWRTKEGFTPFEYVLAFAIPEPDIVQYMVDNGSPIDSRTVHEALMGQYRPSRSERDLKAKYLEILLESVAQETVKDLVNAPLSNPVLGQTLAPLDYATLRGLTKSTQILLSYGADPLLQKPGGETPLDFAKELVHGDASNRATKVSDTRSWPEAAHDQSRNFYASEQLRMQENENTERREILSLLENSSQQI